MIKLFPYSRYTDPVSSPAPPVQPVAPVSSGYANLVYLFLLNCGCSLQQGFIYDNRTNSPIEYKGRMIAYPPEAFEGSTDVIPFDINKASRLVEYLFGRFCEKIYYEEDVEISRVALLRDKTMSKVVFTITNNNKPEHWETMWCRNDALAYTYAMCMVNDINLQEIIDINNAWEVI